MVDNDFGAKGRELINNQVNFITGNDRVIRTGETLFYSSRADRTALAIKPHLDQVATARLHWFRLLLGRHQQVFTQAPIHKGTMAVHLPCSHQGKFTEFCQRFFQCCYRLAGHVHVNKHAQLITGRNIVR